MSVDATIRALRSAIDAGRSENSASADPQPTMNGEADAAAVSTFAAQTLAGQSVDDIAFEKMTVGELAAMIGEMQRMIVSLGAHLGAATEEGSAEQLRAAPSDADALVPSDVERLAEILSAIERSRAA